MILDVSFVKKLFADARPMSMTFPPPASQPDEYRPKEQLLGSNWVFRESTAALSKHVC